MDGPNACETRFEIFQKIKNAWGAKFSELIFPDKNGRPVKGEAFAEARDGCEINRILGWLDMECHCPSHSQRFLITDEESQKPMAKVYYEVTLKSGIGCSGYTDKDGVTDKIQTDGEEELEIVVFSDQDPEDGQEAHSG